MADYSFETIWQFQAPLQDVWDAIFETDLWPTWWRGVEKVELNLLAPIAKPFFQWNHDVVMEWGRECLAKKLSGSRASCC